MSLRIDDKWKHQPGSGRPELNLCYTDCGLQKQNIEKTSSSNANKTRPGIYFHNLVAHGVGGGCGKVAAKVGIKFLQRIKSLY